MRKRLEIIASVIVIVVGVAITPAATGRVGAAMVLVGWLVLVVLRRLHGRAFVAVMAGLLGFVVTAIVVGLFNLGEIAAAFGRSPDFSGRFKVWGAIIPAWLGAPVAGYGFGAVWYYGWWRLDGSDLLTRMNYAAGTFFYHGHNLFMDVLPQLGVLGWSQHCLSWPCSPRAASQVSGAALVLPLGHCSYSRRCSSWASPSRCCPYPWVGSL